MAGAAVAMDGVPTVDLSCAECDLPSEVGAALRRWGFFYVSGHGVPPSLVDAQFAQSAALFALPDQTKRGLTFDLSLDIGYSGGSGVGQSLDPNATAADRKEGFMLTNNAVMEYRVGPGGAPAPPDRDPLRGATLRWPQKLPRYRPVIRRYFAALYALNRRLNGLLFSSLGLSDAEALRLGDNPFAVLKQIRYEAADFGDGHAAPPRDGRIPANTTAASAAQSDVEAVMGAASAGQGARVVATASAPAPAALRLGAGAHTDWGALTLLATDETPGLQVELEGEWWPVPPRAGCFIINAGDQIEALSNGFYRSARHRVVVSSPSPRFSTAFFTYFSFRATVTPPATLVSPAHPLRAPLMATAEWAAFKLSESVGKSMPPPLVMGRAAALAGGEMVGGGRGGEGNGGEEQGGEGQGGVALACGEGDEVAASTPAAATLSTATTCNPDTHPATAAAAAAPPPPLPRLRPGASLSAVPGAPLGIQATGLDLLTATDPEIDALLAALHGPGAGLLIVRNQTLSPQQLETAIFRLGTARGGFGVPLPYEQWPGQSPRLRCCGHLSLLGNYVAKHRDELGTGVRVGERIGEYKPAVDEAQEWHVDGSFLPRPKTGIALYAPPETPMEVCAPCDRQGWRRLVQWLVPCPPRCHTRVVGALPPVGGATAFASTVAGYDSLSPAEQAAAERLDAVHSWCDFMRFLEGRDPARPKASAAQCAARPDVIWPLVRTHPVTGRKGLFLNPKNALRVMPRGGEEAGGAGSCALPTVHSRAAAPAPSGVPPLADWAPLSPAAAAGGLVLNLTQRVLFTGVYSHQWAPGDLVLFDNRVLLHAATPFDASAHERLLFRAEFSGEPVYLY